MTGRNRIREVYGDKTVESLDDFLDHAADAEMLLAAKDQLDTRIAALALQSVIINLGESVKRMERDSSFVTEHAELGLRQIALTRDHAAHSYDGFDHNIAWNALANDLPQIVNAIRAILD